METLNPHKSSKLLQMFPEITVAILHDHNQVTGMKIITIARGKFYLNAQDCLKDIF